MALEGAEREGGRRPTGRLAVVVLLGLLGLVAASRATAHLVAGTPSLRETAIRLAAPELYPVQFAASLASGVSSLLLVGGAVMAYRGDARGIRLMRAAASFMVGVTCLVALFVWSLADVPRVAASPAIRYNLLTSMIIDLSGGVAHWGIVLLLFRAERRDPASLPLSRAL